MDKHDFAELEDPATWSDDEGFIQQPVPNPGAILSVRLSVDEVGSVERAAVALGLRITEFIRTAALERADAVDAEHAASSVRRPA